MVSVSAVLVTRGNVPMHHIYDSLPADWEIIVWSNGDRTVSQIGIEEVPGGRRYMLDATHGVHGASDLSVYGRYAAIEYASHDLIYVQDDDVIVSDPQAITDMWDARDANDMRALLACHLDDYDDVAGGKHVVCNMPQEFRHDGYADSALVGFGAAFHRDLPERVWQKFDGRLGLGVDFGFGGDAFNRTCDVVFTTLTDRVLVDVPKVNREFAEDADRMYRQPDHVGERARMLALARKVRDA